MIRAKTIIEMLGGPKEHIEKVMQKVIETLPEQTGVKVLSKEISEAEEQGKFFSIFADVEIEVESPEALFLFCIDAMPSSVEIIEPEKIELDSGKFSSAINDLQAKLHNTDMLVKNATAENKVLKKNLENTLKNMIKILLKLGDKNIDEISKYTGIKTEHVKKFLDAMIKENLIKNKDDKYTLP